MKKLIITFWILYSCLTYGQDNILLKELDQLKDGSSKLSYVLNLKIDSIPEDGFSKLLKIKLNSDLNTLGDVFAFYEDGKELELSKKEQSILENRVLFFAQEFVKNKRFAIVKSSGGYAPILGVKIDTIAKKEVAVLLMGGSCIKTERDDRRDHIYSIFSKKVRNLLQ